MMKLPDTKNIQKYSENIFWPIQFLLFVIATNVLISDNSHDNNVANLAIIVYADTTTIPHSSLFTWLTQLMDHCHIQSNQCKRENLIVL